MMQRKGETREQYLARVREWNRTHRAERNAAETKYKRKNPEYIREKDKRARRKRRGQVEAPTRPMPEFCEMQGCAPGFYPLHEDHCHETGKFRGWLCSRCNTGLGMLGDIEEGLDLAKAYLQRVKSKL